MNRVDGRPFGINNRGGEPERGQSDDDLARVVSQLRFDFEQDRAKGAVRAELLEALVEDRRRSRRQRLLDGGAAIALIALVFSLFTYWLDGRRIEEASVQNARSELSELIGQLNDIPVEQATINATVDERTASVLGSAFNSRQVSMAAQAQDLLSAYPEIARSLDYLALGQVSLLNGDYAAAQGYLKKAEQLPLSPAVDIAVHRGLAAASYGLGDLETGRSEYQSAVAFAERHDDVTPETSESQAVTTRGLWSGSELNVGNCLQAAEQVGLLNQAAAKTTSPGLYGRPISLQVEGLIAAVAAQCPGTPIAADALARLAEANLPPTVPLPQAGG